MIKVPKKTDLNKYRITLTDSYTDTIPVIKMQGQNIAAKENLTVISAASKAGKTALVQVFIAGLLSSNKTQYSFESFEFIPNDEGFAMVHFDTEQSPTHQQKFIKNVVKRAGLELMPDCFLSYNIRDIHYEEYIEIVNVICEEAAIQFKGVHSIFIDGGADFLRSVNDDVASKTIIQFFTKLSVKHNCPVFIIVHTNPTNTTNSKERGHFGSDLQRKCYSVINIKKEDKISTAYTKFMRDGEEGVTTSYQWSSDAEMHVECEQDFVLKNKDEAQCYECIQPLDVFTYTEFKANVMSKLKLKDRAAEGRISRWLEANFVFHGNDKRYRKTVKSIEDATV